MNFQESKLIHSKPLKKSAINYWGSIPFFLMHLGALAIFFVPFSWAALLCCLSLYAIRMFAITAGYHRYFSHRSYHLNRFWQFCMAFLGTTTVQKGVLWWAANHRLHHQRSDQPNDMHSPIQHGFFHSHVLWILTKDHEETQWKLVKDLAKYPELRWLNKHYLIPPALLGALLFILGGFSLFVWGFLFSTVLLWHVSFCVNSLAHVWGHRRYATPDGSRNNLWLALLTFGEGWHNNHHSYQSSAKQGFFWWEVDFSYYILKALSWIRIVKNLKKPPLKMLEKIRLKHSGLIDQLPELLESVRARKPMKTGY